MRGLAYPGTLFDFTYRNKGEIQAHGLGLRSELLTSLIVEFCIQNGGCDSVWTGFRASRMWSRVTMRENVTLSF